MITVLLFVLGVVVFAVGVAVSIGLHEVGHMVPAKKFGVKVTQYFVGFGRTVWSTRRGETEYGLKAIPLGGYVKLVGMLPPAKDDPLGRPTRGRDMSDGRVRVPTADESAVQRARRIMEELRRKLGDPTRPQEELDYFERLLRRN